MILADLDPPSFMLIMTIVHIVLSFMIWLYSRVVPASGFIELSAYHLFLSGQLGATFAAAITNDESLLIWFTLFSLPGHLFLVLGFMRLLRKSSDFLSCKLIFYYSLIFSIVYTISVYILNITLNDKVLTFTVFSVSFSIISAILIQHSPKKKRWPYFAAAAVFVFDVIQFCVIIGSYLLLGLDYSLMSEMATLTMLKAAVVSILIPCFFILIKFNDLLDMKQFLQSQQQVDNENVDISSLQGLLTQHDVPISQETTLVIITAKFDESIQNKDQYHYIKLMLKHIKQQIRECDIIAMYNTNQIIGLIQHTKQATAKERLYHAINHWESTQSLFSCNYPSFSVVQMRVPLNHLKVR